MLLLLPTCVVSPCACLWPQVSQGWLSLRRASKGALRAALACTFSPAPCTCASVYPHASCLCASSLRLTHSPLNQPDLVLGSSLAAARASPHRAFACPARPRALSRLFVCARCGVCPAAYPPRAACPRRACSVFIVRLCAGWGQGDDGKLILFVFLMELVPAFSLPPSSPSQRAARRCVLPRVPRPACRRVPPVVSEGVRVTVAC